MAFGAISAFLCGGASPPVKSRCRQGIHFRTQVVPAEGGREEVMFAMCGGRWIIEGQMILPAPMRILCIPQDLSKIRN